MVLRAYEHKWTAVVLVYLFSYGFGAEYSQRNIGLLFPRMGFI